MGSNKTPSAVYINFNIDSGGGGDMKDACVILTNIFGEDCLRVLAVVKVISRLHLSSETTNLSFKSE